MQNQSTQHMHQANRSWQSELAFMQQEINYFQNRLEEVRTHDPNGELCHSVDYFKNLFSNKLEMIQALQRSIGIHQHYLAYFKRNRLHAAKVVMPNHQHNHHRLSEIIQRYRDVKIKARSFLAKTLHFKSAPSREI